MFFDNVNVTPPHTHTNSQSCPPQKLMSAWRPWLKKVYILVIFYPVHLRLSRLKKKYSIIGTGSHVYKFTYVWIINDTSLTFGLTSWGILCTCARAATTVSEARGQCCVNTSSPSQAIRLIHSKRMTDEEIRCRETEMWLLSVDADLWVVH